MSPSDFLRAILAPAVSRFRFLSPLTIVIALPVLGKEGPAWKVTFIHPGPVWCLACPGCLCLVLAVSSVTLSILFPDSPWQQANFIFPHHESVSGRGQKSSPAALLSHRVTPVTHRGSLPCTARC